MLNNSFQLYKKIIIGIVLVSLILVFGWKFLRKTEPAVLIPEVVKVGLVKSIIGKSVQGRDIEAYTIGRGKTKIIFVGGIHGGYEWNSVVVAYKFVDYLESNPNVIPENLTVIVIPSLNPDGVYKIIKKEGRFDVGDVLSGVATAPGRFNANQVDLNRNFDCKWQPKSTWQNKTVSAGDKPFSEPESQALKNLIESDMPKAVLFWHSQGGEVYASECQNGILPETLDIMNIYAKASGYGANPTYDAYQTTGDADSWLAKIGIPAITVELKTHEGIDWEENLAGSISLLEYYNSKN